jgi:predicted  nucleic acid-binding Zn-ribbon protein
MGKGNQLPEVEMKDTKIPEFDEFFEKSSDPVGSVIEWNNKLDEMVKEMRSLGSDIKSESTADAPPEIGKLKIQVQDSVVTVFVEKDGQPVPAKNLDKVTKEYLSMVETKAKLLNKRIKSLQKLPGLENMTFKTNPKTPHQLMLAVEKEALDQHKKEDDVSDMQRSLTKFNDRADTLALQLKGPVSLAEAVSALINSMKEELKKKGQELKVAIEDGMPKIEGIPDSVEDFFPELIARAWELLKQMMDFITGLKDQIPELQEKLEALINEAKELPGQLKDAAARANLGAMEALKAAKATSANVKALSGTPVVLKTLAQTLKDTGLELAGGVTGRLEDNKTA